METNSPRRSAALRRDPQQADDVVARMTETYMELRQPLIDRMVHRFGWSREDAEDILQDAWIKLSRAPEPPDKEWKGYVLQAVKTISMDRSEKEGGRSRLQHEEWSKIVRGFGLEQLPEVKITKRPPPEENYFDDSWNVDGKDA